MWGPGDNAALPQRDVPGGISVQIPAGQMSGLIFVKALAANHGGIVAAVLELRKEEERRIWKKCRKECSSR